MSTNDYYLPQTFYPNDERITQRTHRSYWQGPLFEFVQLRFDLTAGLINTI